MYERKLQETRTRKEQQRLKKVRHFYLVLIIIIVLMLFFDNDSLGFSQLILGVRGVIIKGMNQNVYMSSYNFNKDYLKRFTILSLGNYLVSNKPDFIKTVKIKYVFFDKIAVTFVKKQKIVVVSDKDGYHFLDDNGKLWGLPTAKDLLHSIIVFDLKGYMNVKVFKVLQKYANIISEVDYSNRKIYLKKGKIIKFEKWQNLVENLQIFNYVYKILGYKKELYLVDNKIMIK